MRRASDIRLRIDLTCSGKHFRPCATGRAPSIAAAVAEPAPRCGGAVTDRRSTRATC